MTGEGHGQDPVRASDAEREQVAELLRVAAGEGRLTLQELDARLELALSARAGGELAALISDLPDVGGAVPRARDLESIDAGTSSVKRDGRWVVPRAMRIRVDSGRVELDFTAAIIMHPTLEITAEVNSGTLLLIVRTGVEVDAHDVAVGSGTLDLRRARAMAATADPPVLLRIELSGSVRSGGITARPPRPPRRSVAAWLLRRSKPTRR